jgi:hypothetical protein
VQNYGVYTSRNDVQGWILENVTNYPMAKLAEEVNGHFGIRTLIVGPATTFPQFLET